ncbi:MAG TPA: hypothetical protein VGB45_05205 [Abditibacterium sp.]|jgi:hypothetical protein
MPPKVARVSDALKKRFPNDLPAQSPQNHREAAATLRDASTDFEIRPSHDEAKLNKTERAWLDVVRGRGYSWVGVQNISFKIGDDCRYNPDILVLDGGNLVAFEVKGFMRDDALVKLKATARAFSWLKIVLVKREDGQWTESEVRP